MSKICVRRKREDYFSLHTQLTAQLEPANVLGLSFLFKSMDICARSCAYVVALRTVTHGAEIHNYSADCVDHAYWRLPNRAVLVSSSRPRSPLTITRVPYGR